MFRKKSNIDNWQTGLLVVFLFSLSACSTGKITKFNPYKKYGPSAMQQELDIVKNIFEKEHPSIYWYNAKPVVDAAFESARHQLNDSLTELQFKKILSEAVSSLQCGHTSVRNSKKMENWLSVAKPSLFPFGMRVFHDSMVVSYNLYGKDTLLKRGTVVDSINGYSSKQIIDSIFKSFSSDGFARNFKNIRLSGNYPFHYAQSFDTVKKYHIVYTDSMGRQKKLTTSIYRVPPKDTTKKIPLVKVVRLTKKQQKKIKKASIYKVVYDTASLTAYVTLNSFSGGKQKSFFRKTFRQVKKAGFKNLVLDVRNNGGGLISNSSALSKYLIQKPNKIADTVSAKVRFSSFNRYVKYRFWYGLSMVLLTKKKKDGNYHFGHFERHLDKPKKKYHFDGKLYIITGGYSFSATSLLLNALKGQSNVTVVGEETGGGAYGNSAVYIPDITLPNTKIRVRLPVFRLVMDKNKVKNGLGIYPDIYIPPTLHSIKFGKDNKMDTIKELIQKAL